MSDFYYKWSIAIYSGASPLALTPSARPVLTTREVTDVKAMAVADPFLLRRGATLYMFFEVLNAANGRGEIAYAASENGFDWRYGGIVMTEPFHLSYPQVFEWDGAVFMIPETRQAQEVRLYRCEDFPRRWRPVETLLRGSFADSTIFRQGATWWLFAQRGLDEMRLYHAEQPAGPWREHPMSPLWPGNRVRTRPGGRVIVHEGRTIRLAQDGWPNYGSALRAYEILRLDRSGYVERELDISPIFRAARSGWNALGMHHLDVLRLDDGRWIGAVDGATLGQS